MSSHFSSGKNEAPFFRPGVDKDQNQTNLSSWGTQLIFSANLLIDSFVYLNYLTVSSIF